VRVLVTGADGFVGPYLVRALQARGDAVVACGGPGGPDGLEITDGPAVESRVRDARPDGIIHLAGVSSVAWSHEHPASTMQVNVIGAANLLEAARRHVPGARLLLVGSGEVYGAVAKEHRAVETDAIWPLSPYAASKAAAEILARQMAASYGVAVVLVRSFNHLGLGQSPGFVVPSLARQLLDAASGRSPPVIEAGDLSPVRDFSHVGDVVDGYLLLLERGTLGEVYNLCSGEGRSIRAVLDELQALLGTSVEVRVDPRRLRPVEIPWLVGNPAKAEALGWKRRRTVREALQELIDSLRGASPFVPGSASSSTR
jgi:GDP-4-dehydro-6-deoxy-D-mannose reductase